MATELKSRDLSDHFRFTEFGQRAIGQVDKFFGPTGKYNTYSMVLAPAVIRTSKDGNLWRYGSVAIGLSGDLLGKIDQRTATGKYLSLEYVRTEPSKKGSDTKIFRVLVLSDGEYEEAARRADDTYAMNAYKAPKQQPSGVAPDEDDDLPF